MHRSIFAQSVQGKYTTRLCMITLLSTWCMANIFQPICFALSVLMKAYRMRTPYASTWTQLSPPWREHHLHKSMEYPTIKAMMTRQSKQEDRHLKIGCLIQIVIFLSLPKLTQNNPKMDNNMDNNATTPVTPPSSPPRFNTNILVQSLPHLPRHANLHPINMEQFLLDVSWHA